jgi:ABC-2 type transport system permease protein
MILKSLFINLQKEDLKRKIWTLALLLLIFFLALPVVNALNLESIDILFTWEKINDIIIPMIGPENSGLAIITIIAAIICGISSFYYVHSKRQIDFYHSTPVRRGTLFAVNYLDGFLIYFVTYGFNLLLSFAVLAANGYLSREIFLAAMTAMLINCTYYLMIYTIVVIAVMLTGNFIVSCLASAAILLYGPTLMIVKEEYFREFFVTYYPEMRLQSGLKFLSPIWIYLGVNDDWSRGESILLSIVIAAAVTAALIAFAFFLYLKRPSEAAGKAMAFAKSKLVVKVLLVVLLSLGGGALFFNITHDSDGWFIFGIVFALLVSHAVIEIVYQFDIRGILRNKRQLLICGLLVGAIASCFRFDLFQFDSYLPEEDEIQNMAVSISGIDDSINYIDFENGEYKRYGSSDYQLKYMKLTKFTDAYELAKMGISTGKDYRRYGGGGISYTYYVKYNLKNGKTAYRQYRLRTSDTYQQMKRIYESSDYKEAHYPLLHWDTAKVGKVSLRYFSEMINHKEFGMDGKESYALALPGTEKQEFLSTYMEELKTLTLDEVKDTEPLATVIFEYNTYSANSYYIYPSFTKTLELMKKYGFDTAKKIELKDIRRITVSDYRPKYEQTTVDGITSTSMAKDSYKEETYRNPEQIAQILPNLVSRDYFYSNITLIEGDDYTDVILYVFNEDYNSEVSYGYLFKKGAIPDFVKSGLMIKD